MVYKIHCAVIINTGKIETATRLFEAFRIKFLEVPIQNYTNNIYWKDSTKHRAEFDFEMNSESRGIMLESFITMMSKISSNWHLILASNLNAENFEMSCISSEVTVEGIDWVNFEA